MVSDKLCSMSSSVGGREYFKIDATAEIGVVVEVEDSRSACRSVHRKNHASKGDSIGAGPLDGCEFEHEALRAAETLTAEECPTAGTVDASCGVRAAGS